MSNYGRLVPAPHVPPSRGFRAVYGYEPMTSTAPGDLGPGRVTPSRNSGCHCTRCSVRRTVDELVRGIAA